MNTCTMEAADLKERLAAKDAELSQLSVKSSELIDVLNCVKSQSAARAICWDDEKSVAGNCKRPNRRAWMARQYKESSTTPSMAAFSVVLAGREDYKNRCEALTVENQCIFRLGSEENKIREQLVKRDKAGTATKTTPKG